MDSSQNNDNVVVEELLNLNVEIEIPVGSQCYCSKPRDYSQPDFLCSVCYKWFHLSCIDFNIGKSIPFITTYHFMCKVCNQSGDEEIFTKKQANFAVMCQTALANLIYKNNGRLFFSKENDIIPFLEENWEELTTQPRRSNKSWHGNIHKTLISNDLFKKYEIDDDVYVTLICNDLAKIGPSYDRFKALTSQLKTNITSNQSSENDRKRKASQITASVASSGQGYHLAMNEDLGSGNNNNEKNILSSNAPLSRSTRRNTAGHFLSSIASNTQSSNDTNEGKSKLNPFGMPVDHPLNREGYSYILVEPDPHAQGRQLWDECEYTGGKPIPGLFYRVVHPSGLILSQHDKAIHLKLSDNHLAVTGEKGYGAIRASHSVNLGTWYFECKITDLPENAATRIGWAQNLSNLQAPIGYDKFGYSWRSLLGTIFHEAKGKHYSEGYTKNDVIGCLIVLPPRQRDRLTTIEPNIVEEVPPKNNEKPSSKKNAKGKDIPATVYSNKLWNYLPETFKDKPLIKFRNSFYFEERGEPQKAEKYLKKLKGSKIIYYKNGVCQGEAFSDIYLGSYYPAISIYKSATVSVNFGPNFEFPPTNDHPTFKPLQDRIVETDVEQCLADMIYLVDNDGLVESLVAKCIESRK